MEWSDAYSVGVKKIDEEHKRLIDLINTAYDTVEEGYEDDVALAMLVADMVQYARIHFETEAEFMKEYAYPGAAEHMKEHGSFTARAVTSGDTPSQDWTLDPIHVFKFLADWLNHHILEVDKELGEYLIKKGVK